LIGKTELYEESHAYLRISQVGPGLAKQIWEARQQLRSKKAGGLILDLRFSDGQDYAAAAEVADLFLTNELPLLKLGEVVSRSTVKTMALDRPVAVLVNRQTAGAAEALAAMLRQTEAGLLIGSSTAGQAHQFKEFTLRTGQRLKVASGTVQLGDGTVLSEKGLSPDIRVEVSSRDEQKYFQDPYQVVPQLLAEALRTNGAEASPGVSGTNRVPRRRMNETDLVRQRREGSDLDGELPNLPTDQPAKPVLQDPALARAIDFLKGLALLRSRR
jgi:C-terminal processing protease CtpA/Prc